MLLNSVPDLLRSLGRESFVRHCLSTINTLVPVNHLVIFTFDDHFVPHYLSGAALEGANISFDLAQLYTRYFYLLDPGIRALKQIDEYQGSTLLKLRARDIQNAQYREQIYTRHQLLERLSWLGQTEDCWYSANLYRDVATGPFSQRDKSVLQAQADLLCSAIEKHIALCNTTIHTRPSIAWLEALIADLNDSLSTREIEVSSRAVSGMTRNGIGLDLGIKPTTVSTLLQRAYGKLAITSLNELFMLCLEALRKQR